MNRKGYLLIEALIGLFLLGVIATACLPIVNMGINNIRITKDKMNMLFIAESIIEKIKAFDHSWVIDEYILDMNLRELISMFEDSDITFVELPLNDEKEDSKYFYKIYKEDYGRNLWKIRVSVNPIKGDEDIEYIDIFVIMPVPDKGEL